MYRLQKRIGESVGYASRPGKKVGKRTRDATIQKVVFRNFRN